MGGGPYVLKEKFKDKLKIWNKEHFGDLQRRRRIIEYEMIILDKKGEKWGLPLKKCVLREKKPYKTNCGVLLCLMNPS